MVRKWALPGIFIILLLLSIVTWPVNPFDLSMKKIEVPRGSSVRGTQQILVSRGLLPRWSLFRPIVKLLGLQNRIQAGVYLLSPSDPLPRVIAKLVVGETVPPLEARVTFPEGTSIYKMGKIMESNGFSDWRDFQGLVNEGITAGLRGKFWNIFKYVPSESLEGYLYPDTYQFFLNASAEVLAAAMVERFDQVVMPYWESNKQKTKFGLHEILTLASIIEKEAQKPEERSVIASVFYNRLKIGMPLAADPTIKYALENPSKKVFYDQLNVKSPYNTYKVRGLPPGPICNPGLASIKAALFPAKTEYLFFVAKADGSHAFSKTWQQHQRARQTIPTR